MTETSDTTAGTNGATGMIDAIDENLSVEVTTHCTNECGHCFARAGLAAEAAMTIGPAAAVLADGRAAGFRRLHITGGEPLFWPPLFDFIAEARRLGYEGIFMNTNGHLLDTGAARRLAGAGLPVTLSVSIQGPEEAHDRLRGSASWARARAGLRAALDEGLGACVFTTATRSLLPLVPRFTDSLYREFPGITSHTLIQVIRVTDDARDLSEELLAPGDFLALVRAAALLNLAGYRTEILENPLAQVAAQAMAMPWLPPAPPLHRPGKLVVMADGALTLAHSTRESLGEWRPGAIAAVLASPPYAAAVAPDETTCPLCPYATPCRAHGMLRPSEWFRDHETDRPYCQRVLELAG